MAAGLAVACGGKRAVPLQAIELSAPVTNFRPSGWVASVELSWTPVAQVERYHVIVRSPAGSELWQVDSAAPPVVFSTEGIMAVRAQWQVQGFAGTTLRARSAWADLDLGRAPGSPPP